MAFPLFVTGLNNGYGKYRKVSHCFLLSQGDCFWNRVSFGKLSHATSALVLAIPHHLMYSSISLYDSRKDAKFLKRFSLFFLRLCGFA